MIGVILWHGQICLQSIRKVTAALRPLTSYCSNLFYKLSSFQHMDCIQKIAVLLARVRHCLPRFLFQRLQTTTVKVTAAHVTQMQGRPLGSWWPCSSGILPPLFSLPFPSLYPFPSPPSH